VRLVPVGSAGREHNDRGNKEHTEPPKSLFDGRWLMVNGQWSMVNGRWSMVDGRWSMADGW
jgi:hypothetical protein